MYTSRVQTGHTRIHDISCRVGYVIINIFLTYFLERINFCRFKGKFPGVDIPCTVSGSHSPSIQYLRFCRYVWCSKQVLWPRARRAAEGKLREGQGANGGPRGKEKWRECLSAYGSRRTHLDQYSWTLFTNAHLKFQLPTPRTWNFVCFYCLNARSLIN